MDFPLHPPVDWFAPPSAGIPIDRRLTIEASGRVYGYVSLWESCHVGLEGCVKPPRGSATDYEYAHVGETIAVDGEDETAISTAVIAAGIPHPGPRAKPSTVPDTYANTGHQMMRVKYGEDTHGLWFAGALFPDVDPVAVEHIRASAVSGDWRWHTQWRKSGEGSHEFSGAILVNVPGYRMHTAGSRVEVAGEAVHIAASATPEGFSGIIGFDDHYSNTGEDTTMSDTNDDGKDEGGGCGCGGDKKAITVTAGAFEGTGDDLFQIIMNKIGEALSDAGVVDDDEGLPEEVIEAASVKFREAITAPHEGGELEVPGLDAVNMKLDQVLEQQTRIENALAEREAMRLAEELTA